MLYELFDRVPNDQEIGMVTTDGACACYNAVAERDAHAVIPTRRNARSWKPTTPWAEACKEIL